MSLKAGRLCLKGKMKVRHEEDFELRVFFWLSSDRQKTRQLVLNRFWPKECNQK